MRKKRHWHRYGPPWWDGGREWNGEGDAPLPPWLRHPRPDREWHANRRRLFFRFAAVFGLFVLLGCSILVVLAVAAFLFFPPSVLQWPNLQPFFYGLVPLALLLVLALRRVGIIAARRLTTPLSETMKAADALAAGDLSARVPVEGSGEFRHFSRSFNRMAEALETADRQRRELLADVAHELRTPLTIIQGNLEGLRDGVYEATSEQLDLVLDETHKLSRLVDDLRLLTLAEAGQLPLDIQTIEVGQLLADVRDAFALQAAEAGIALTVDAPGPLPGLRADPQRMGQILGNLVTNALRHTPSAGQVKLGAALDPETGGMQIWVSDNGEGIAAQDLPRIFDRFWRGDPARFREAGAGSGLGLAIAKSLVEAHGGSIRAESQLGQGTIVSCILPLPPED
jgi:signal transduction histidine kinase